MVVTMVLVSALLAGSAVLASVQIKSSRSAELTKASISALHCAESGIVAARATVMNSYGSWNAALAAGTEPAWLTAVDHDVDNDGEPDFTITLKDNDDESAPTANNVAVDNDLTIYIVSTCIKYPDVQTQVAEMVRFNGSSNCYQSQLGGCGGNNNAN